MTLPAMTIPSKMQPRSTSARSASTQRMRGAFSRATANIAASRSTPTTSRPRRLNSMATRPVPQPASSTERGPERGHKVGLTVDVVTLGCESVEARVVLGPPGRVGVEPRIATIGVFHNSEAVRTHMVPTLTDFHPTAQRRCHTEKGAHPGTTHRDLSGSIRTIGAQGGRPNVNRHGDGVRTLATHGRRIWRWAAFDPPLRNPGLGGSCTRKVLCVACGRGPGDDRRSHRRPPHRLETSQGPTRSALVRRPTRTPAPLSITG